MKITFYFFDELTEEQRIRVINQASENGVNLDYLEEDFVPALVNAEVVVDEDFFLYDVRICDPYHYVKSEGNTQIYINADGWTNWLLLKQNENESRK